MAGQRGGTPAADLGGGMEMVGDKDDREDGPGS